MVAGFGTGVGAVGFAVDRAHWSVWMFWLIGGGIAYWMAYTMEKHDNE
jgi:hypothetical protein